MGWKRRLRFQAAQAGRLIPRPGAPPLDSTPTPKTPATASACTARDALDTESYVLSRPTMSAATPGQRRSIETETLSRRWLTRLVKRFLHLCVSGTTDSTTEETGR